MNPIIYVGKDFHKATERLPLDIRKKVTAFFPKFKEKIRHKGMIRYIAIEQ